MPITSTPPVTPGAATTAAPTTSAADAAASALNQDMFLKLMVAQLRNQDPLNPTDSTQFLAQTAQFTSVARLNEVSETTAKALSAQMAFGASSLIGRSVTYVDGDGNHVDGTVAAVRFETSGPVLDIGGEDVTISQVVTVGVPAAGPVESGDGASDGASGDASGDTAGASADSGTVTA